MDYVSNFNSKGSDSMDDDIEFRKKFVKWFQGDYLRLKLGIS